MPLNIRPFDFQYRGLGPGPQQVTTPSWGPPDMSKQLQEGIGNILPELAKSYKAVNEQRNMELQGATLDKARAALGAGNTYQSSGTAAGGGPITAANASPQSQQQYTFSKEVEPLFQSTATATGVSPDYYRRVAGIESGGQLTAKNPNSSATGLFQFTDATWKDYGGGGDRMNANDQFAAMGRLTVANRDNLRSVLGRDPTDGELYLAHQQGAGGAKALLSNPTGNVVDVLSSVYGGDRATAEKAVRNNGGNANMTANQFAARWVGGTANTPGGGYGGTMGAPPTVVAASTVQPGDTVAPGASAVSSGKLSDPALAYKTRLQEMYPNIRVTSEFRSQADNNRVGGVGGSQHLSGNALDVDVSKLSDQEKQAFVNDAIANGAKGIGWYNNRSMHVDFRQTPAAWGPNKSYSSIGQTPPWFQEAAAKLKGGSVNAASSPVPASNAPSQVAASSPGVVTQTPAVRGATPGGQNQQPLFSTPQLQGATQAAGQQPPPGQNPTQAQNPNPQTALQGAPTPTPAEIPPTGPNVPLQAPPPQPMVPGTEGMVAGPGVPASTPQPAPQTGGLTFGDVLAVPNLSSETKTYFARLAQTQGGEKTPIDPRVIAMDPDAPPEAKALAQSLIERPTSAAAAQAAASLPNTPPTRPPQAAGAADPTVGPAGVQTLPNRPPPPVAAPAPAAATPAPAQPQGDPATTGSVASRPNLPPATQAALAQAGVQQPNAMDGLSLELLARAFKTGNPNVVNSTVGAINALNAQRNAGQEDWSLQHDARGNWFRYNKRTGATEAVQTPYGNQGQPAGDQIINPGDPNRAKLGIPEGDPRSWRVSYDDKGNRKIEPISQPDERESKEFERESSLRKEFETDKQVAKFKEAGSTYRQLVSSANTGNAVGDISLIYQYMKMLDPDSAVREGEFALAGQTGSLPQNVVQEYNRLLTGERLSDAKRGEYVNQAGRLLESRQGDMVQRSDYFTRIAQSKKIAPENVTGGIKADYKFEPWQAPGGRNDQGEKLPPDPRIAGNVKSNPFEVPSHEAARGMPKGTFYRVPGQGVFEVK